MLKILTKSAVGGVSMAAFISCSRDFDITRSLLSLNDPDFKAAGNLARFVQPF